MLVKLDSPSLFVGMQEFRDRATDFKLSVTNQLLRMLSLSDRQISVGDDDDDERLGYFSMLPVSHNENYSG
jgi:hypothetical protein